MKSIEKAVMEVSGACLENIKRNIIEKRTREAIGDLIVKKTGKIYIAINAYPWDSSKTTPTMAYLGDHNDDESPRVRVWSVDKQKRKENSNGSSIRGQYHSHIHEGYEKRNYIHKEDMKFFREIMKNYLEIDESLQIVASLKRRNYQGRTDIPTKKVQQYKKKLRIKERIKRNFKPTNGLINIEEYDIIFAAYVLNQKKCREIPIRERIIRVIRKGRAKY